MTSRKFHRLFGGPPRRPETPLTQREKDLAASIQKVTEEIMLRAVRHVRQETGMRNLCLAGGVALNCVGNGRVLREGPFDDIWIQPAAGDAGGALGVALLIWHQLLGNSRQARAGDSQTGSLLGPRFSGDQIKKFLDDTGAVYTELEEDRLLDRVAELLEQEKVVGWMQGRMEFGPRALGSRSILGDARSEKMQSQLNLKIKFRESFRPFAPVVLNDCVADYFEIDRDSPYMLLTADVKKPVIPAVTHVDNSARLQTVDAGRHGRFHRLMKRFQQKTGCAVLINTSFNVRGEPIVCTPQDAWRCFMATNMDALVLERCLLMKTDQAGATEHEIDEHLAKFPLD